MRAVHCISLSVGFRTAAFATVPVVLVSHKGKTNLFGMDQCIAKMEQVNFVTFAEITLDQTIFLSPTAQNLV